MALGVFLSALLLAQATPKPCSHPARLVKAPQMPWPTSIPRNTPRFDVEVFITVEPDGSVQNAHVWKPSGYPDADAIAVETAKESMYEPAVGSDCKPTTADYLYRARFQP